MPRHKTSTTRGPRASARSAAAAALAAEVVAEMPAPSLGNGSTAAAELAQHQSQQRVDTAAERHDAANRSQRLVASGDTVTVACKMPGGLLLRLTRLEDRPYATPGGGIHAEKIGTEYGTDRIKLNGYAAPAGNMPLHGMPVIGGYGLTYGVDRAFFEAWLEQNKDSDIVRNRLVFAHGDERRVRDQAKDQATITDGLGPLIPDTDPRITKVDPKYKDQLEPIKTRSAA